MKKTNSGFTLIELLVTIAIIAILASMLAPAAGRMAQKANSTKCASNLRQIGASVLLYSQDNDNRFPAIESMPSDPVYDSSSDGPPKKPIFETLSPYGVTKSLLQCPADIRGQNYFAKEGSSYQWRNIVDTELTSDPKVYGRRGARNPKSTWLLLLTDYENVHNGHGNRLYADGHVIAQ
jgi:prepilin-type N-terminal cleavage/methylation domain-containing protein/prepilin-type processing-associated H-X9-DG protein